MIEKRSLNEEQTEIEPVKAPRKKGRWLKLGIVLVVISGLAGGLWYLWSFLQMPAVGIAEKTQVKYDLSNPEAPPAIRTFSGRYFSLTVPNSYQEKIHETPDNGNVLERVFFSEEDVSSRKIAIVAEKRPENGLHELTAYVFRDTTTDQYEKRTIHQSDGTGVPIFLKKDPVYEITGFLEQGDAIISISLSSAIRTTDSLMADFLDVLSALRLIRK